MKQVGQKFFVLATLASVLCLTGMTFAEENTPGPPSYPGYTQIKPELPVPVQPDQERSLPDRFPERLPTMEDMTLLDHPSMERIAPVSEYWIGVQCAEVMPALRSHLNLDESEGMLVEGVVPESPAAKSGVEQYDVILAVNGKPVQKIEDIISTVDEVKDGELTLSAIRKGKPVELKLTPEKRPDRAKLPAMPSRQEGFRFFGPGVTEQWTPDSPQQDIPEDMKRMIEQIQKQMEEQMKNFPESGRFRIESQPRGFGGGGMQMFGGPDAGTNTMQITIEPARDDVEATLTVRKNGQTWSVSHFSDLPESVQKDVAEILKNTVDGKDVAGWIDEQMKSNRRMTFSVTTSANAPETPQSEPKPQ
ncbi:MAG: PDZ domain-containing protein [Planctomycetaceae bacterium]|nr:PDZ domain-containing protein [Planctomycetaceae bacterium]